MQKVSTQDASALLKQAGASIRKLVAENVQLRKEASTVEYEGRVSKLAQVLEDKGLMDELSHEEKVAHLKSATDITVVEEAVKLAAPQGNLLGVTDDVPGNGASAFEAFIATGDA